MHWKNAKHIPASVRRDRYNKRRGGILLAAASGMFGGYLGAAFIALLLASNMIPNPRHAAGVFRTRNLNWEDSARNMPQDEFYSVFRMPSFQYAERLSRAMNIPPQFTTSQRYKCSGLEGLLLLHARLGSSSTWKQLATSLPHPATGRMWSYAKMSAVFGT